MKLKVGDMIKHYKYNILSQEEKKRLKHIYIVISVDARIQCSSHVIPEPEDGDMLMCVYKQVSYPYMTFVRPVQEMFDIVNKNGQEHRFEIIKDKDIHNAYKAVKEENSYDADEHNTGNNHN